MTDTKFTPGTWSYDEERKHIVVEGDYDVCNLDIGWDEDSEQEIEEMYATAHLIAAAPEIYEALTDVLGLIPLEFEQSPMVSFAKSALAKARGETL